jgi:signal peptidase I
VRSPVERVRSFARVVVGVSATLLVVAAAAALLVSAIAPRVGWFRMETVLSGSMRPTFSPGDLILVRPEPTPAVRVGQAITYAIPIGDHHVETHRVVRIVHRGAHPVVVTRGDANGAADPWQARLQGATTWRLWLVVPKLGLVVHGLRSPLVHLALVVFLPFFLAAGWLRRLWTSPAGS